MNAIIETRGLTRRFGRTEAIHDLSLSIPEGSIHAFLGPNGAGKTTTIKTLLNLISPTAGEARVLGTDTRRLGPAERARIGYVSENQKLPEGMTVSELVAYCRPMYPEWDDAFCARLRKEFDLPPDRKLRHLSRGMRVKAALLVSLAYRPRLLILDEPFSGLDPLMRDEFARGVLELSEQENWTVFISSHDIEEVERLADGVSILNAGRLHLSETTESLQARFRRVEFVVGEENRRLPGNLPPAWLGVESAGHSVRFVTGDYRPGQTEAEVAARFPDAARLTVSPLPLREIFLALARAFRLASSY